jgi:hypothetical protein
MESRVVPLHCVQQVSHCNLRVQFLLDLALQGLLRAFARLNLSARELPPTLPFAIPALGGEDFSRARILSL